MWPDSDLPYSYKWTWDNPFNLVPARRKDNPMFDNIKPGQKYKRHNTWQRDDILTVISKNDDACKVLFEYEDGERLWWSDYEVSEVRFTLVPEVVQESWRNLYSDGTVGYDYTTRAETTRNAISIRSRTTAVGYLHYTKMSDGTIKWEIES